MSVFYIDNFDIDKWLQNLLIFVYRNVVYGKYFIYLNDNK